MVCYCVCLSVGHERDFGKTGEPIEMPFGMWTHRGGGKEPCVRWGPGPSLAGMGTFDGDSMGHDRMCPAVEAQSDSDFAR